MNRTVTSSTHVDAWTCQNCTFANEPSHLVCAVCSVQNPHAAVGPFNRRNETKDETKGDLAPEAVVALFDDVPDNFRCPITHELLRDPVLISDGISYERSAIIDWLTRSEVSPSTNLKLESAVMMPNIALTRAIADWCEAKRTLDHRPSVVQKDALTFILSVKKPTSYLKPATHADRFAWAIDTSGVAAAVRQKATAGHGRARQGTAGQQGKQHTNTPTHQHTIIQSYAPPPPLPRCLTTSPPYLQPEPRTP